MTVTDKQIAAGAAAIRAAESQHSPEEVAQAVFEAMSKPSNHKERLAELNADIAAENEAAAEAAPKRKVATKAAK